MGLYGDMWFDSHLHFDRFDVQQRVEAILEQAAEAGVSKFLAVGGSSEANERSRALLRPIRGACMPVLGMIGIWLMNRIMPCS